MPIIHLDKRTGIKAIHGRIGEFIFYMRNGKQYVRRRSVHTPSGDYRDIIEPLSSHCRTIIESDANH